MITLYINDWKNAMLLVLDALSLDFELQAKVISQVNMIGTCDKRLPHLIDKAHQRLNRRVALLENLEKKGD